MDERIKIGTVMFYARILPKTENYEVCELKIRTVTDSYFVGSEAKTNHAFIFGETDVDNNVFFIRKEALKKVKEAQKNKKKKTSVEDEIMNELIAKDIER